MRIVVLSLFLLLAGCGPSLRDRQQQATSDMNVLADTWDGKEAPPSMQDKVDPWGHAYTASVSKGMLNYVLEVRSNGPDGLPKNKDDMVVTRYARHGDTTINKEVERGGASLTRGLTKGVKEGWYGTPEKEKK